MSGLRFTIPLHRDQGPWPVSVNRLHRAGSDGRPKLAPGARRWRQTVEGEAWLAWQLLTPADRAALVAAPIWQVAITLDWGRWHARRPDSDNVLKLILDGIKRGTGIDDERYQPVVQLAGPGAMACLHVAITGQAGG